MTSKVATWVSPFENPNLYLFSCMYTFIHYFYIVIYVYIYMYFIHLSMYSSIYLSNFIFIHVKFNPML